MILQNLINILVSLRRGQHDVMTKDGSPYQLGDILIKDGGPNTKEHGKIFLSQYSTDCNKCKNCKNFKRGKWYGPLERDYQKTGHCDLLLKMFKIDNSNISFIEKLVVQDTFGCVLAIPK